MHQKKQIKIVYKNLTALKLMYSFNASHKENKPRAFQATDWYARRSSGCLDCQHVRTIPSCNVTDYPK